MRFGDFVAGSALKEFYLALRGSNPNAREYFQRVPDFRFILYEDKEVKRFESVDGVVRVWF